MSMPKFPEINPEMTCDRALNMVLASIAMEEVALSNVVNAESEKIRYVLGLLETSGDKKYDINEVLKVNQSVTNLMDSISQYQMLLKNKMDKAINALSSVCPRPPTPPCPTCPTCPTCPPTPPDPPCPPRPPVCPCHPIPCGPKGDTGPQGERGPAGPPGPSRYFCKCSATFQAAEKCKKWCGRGSLSWNKEHLHGKCICVDPCDKTKIELCTKGRFLVNLSVNVRNKGCESNAAVDLLMIKNHQRSQLYTVYSHVPCDEIVTISMSGIIVENFDCACALLFRLESQDSLIVDDYMLSIIEI